MIVYMNWYILLCLYVVGIYKILCLSLQISVYILYYFFLILKINGESPCFGVCVQLPPLSSLSRCGTDHASWCSTCGCSSSKGCEHEFLLFLIQVHIALFVFCFVYLVDHLMSEESITICKIDSKKALKRKAKVELEAGVDLKIIRNAWTQCIYYMTGKKRFCNISRAPGSEYCG